jgi:2'-5' RNA ligase
MRLFVGIEIPSDIAADLYPIGRALRGVDAQTPDNMHLTLKFIGNVDPGLAAEVDEVLSKVRFDPFDLQISGLGLFASTRKARILWAGVKDQPELSRLAGRVENALAQIEEVAALLDGRKFTPHITLARNREAPRAVIEQCVADHANLRSEPFSVQRFCLYQSHQTDDGPKFEILAAYTGEDE